MSEMTSERVIVSGLTGLTGRMCVRRPGRSFAALRRPQGSRGRDHREGHRGDTHLVRTAIGRGHASESRMGTQDERQRENEELGHHCGGVDE